MTPMDRTVVTPTPLPGQEGIPHPPLNRTGVPRPIPQTGQRVPPLSWAGLEATPTHLRQDKGYLPPPPPKTGQGLSLTPLKTGPGGGGEVPDHHPHPYSRRTRYDAGGTPFVVTQK